MAVCFVFRPLDNDDDDDVFAVCLPGVDGDGDVDDDIDDVDGVGEVCWFELNCCWPFDDDEFDAEFMDEFDSPFAVDWFEVADVFEDFVCFFCGRYL